MYLKQLKQLEMKQVEEKYNNISYTEKENLEKILKIFLESQLKLQNIQNLEKLREYSKEPIDVIKLSTVLKNHTLEKTKAIHNELERNGYYNDHDYILVKEYANTEALEEEMLEKLITDEYFIQETFDLDYLIDIFIEEKTHQEVMRELQQEENILENLLNIELVEAYVDEDGNTVKKGDKYY